MYEQLFINDTVRTPCGTVGRVAAIKGRIIDVLTKEGKVIPVPEAALELLARDEE